MDSDYDLRSTPSLRALGRSGQLFMQLRLSPASSASRRSWRVGRRALDRATPGPKTVAQHLALLALERTRFCGFCAGLRWTARYLIIIQLRCLLNFPHSVVLCTEGQGLNEATRLLTWRLETSVRECSTQPPSANNHKSPYASCVRLQTSECRAATGGR